MLTGHEGYKGNKETDRLGRGRSAATLIYPNLHVVCFGQQQYLNEKLKKMANSENF